MTLSSAEELEELTDIVTGLSVLKFFPQSNQAIATIVEDVGQMVSTMDHARWLVKRMRERFDEWPGPVTLRETYVDCYPDQTETPDDPPHPFWLEHSQEEIRCLPAPNPNPDLIRDCRPWPEELKFELRLPVRKITQEVPLLVPGKDFKPITADDIEEARRKAAREKAEKAAQDLG